MTKEQAKEVLAVYRPGMDDERDPTFAEALQLARSDRELQLWFEESMAFDRNIRVALGQVTAPGDVREAILAERKIIRPAHWWHHKLTGREMAAAAVVLLAATLLGLWFTQRPAQFADFRREIADQSWGSSPHLELKSSDMAEVRRFLTSRQIGTNFTLPPILADSEIHGCNLMRWKGHEVPVICFNSKGQHLHLVVVDRSLFPDAPTYIPEMDRWQAWRTASWSKDTHSYVLTGLSTPTFVKKFRRDRRWDWES
jgi:hypothetical protein